MRARARAVFLFVLALPATALCSGSAWQDLAGRWRGDAIPVVSFLPRAPLPFEICVGRKTVSGWIGDARITGGDVKKIASGITRLFVHADYEITVKIEGELVRGTGIRRKKFRVYVTGYGPGVRAFASSDGSFVFPWSGEAALRDGMMVQTAVFVLTKTPRPIGSCESAI